MTGTSVVHNHDQELTEDYQLHECRLCNRYTSNRFFCDDCKPNTCLFCTASHVYFDTDDNQFHCSHGCSYTLYEYTHRRLITEAYNSKPVKRLQYAGRRLEYIIPEGTDVTIHGSEPDTISKEHVLGIHYSPNADVIIDTGELLYPPHEHEKHRQSEEITPPAPRDGAVYAWPHTYEFTQQMFSWSHDPVFLEIPRDAVYVSSYRLLNLVSNSDEWLEVHPDYYAETLTFTPEQLATAVSQYRRPVHPNDLYLTNPPG